MEAQLRSREAGGCQAQPPADSGVGSYGAAWGGGDDGQGAYLSAPAAPAAGDAFRAQDLLLSKLGEYGFSALNVSQVGPEAWLQDGANAVLPIHRCPCALCVTLWCCRQVLSDIQTSRPAGSMDVTVNEALDRLLTSDDGDDSSAATDGSGGGGGGAAAVAQAAPAPKKPSSRFAGTMFALWAGKKYHFFLSHSRRSGTSIIIAGEIFAFLTRLGFKVWLDVKQRDRSVAAMQKGVEESMYFIAIVGMPEPNPERPSDPPETNAYFAREYCVKEMEWAVSAGTIVIPVVHSMNKGNIGAIVRSAPEHLRFIGEIDFIDVDRNDFEVFNLGIRKILRASTHKGNEAGLDCALAEHSGGGGGGGGFPAKLGAWAERMGLSAAKKADVLAWLCGEETFGATDVEDLKNLEPDDIDHLVGLVPRAKQKAVRQLLEAARGAPKVTRRVATTTGLRS